MRIPSAWFHPGSLSNISERVPFMQKCQYLTRTHLENFCVMERYLYCFIAQLNSYTGIQCVVVIILSGCKNTSSFVSVAEQHCLHPLCVLYLNPTLIPKVLWLTCKSVPQETSRTMHEFCVLNAVQALVSVFLRFVMHVLRVPRTTTILMKGNRLHMCLKIL